MRICLPMKAPNCPLCPNRSHATPLIVIYSFINTGCLDPNQNPTTPIAEKRKYDPFL